MAMSRRRWLESLARPARANDDVLRLHRNENPVGPSPATLGAIAESLPAAGRYPDKAVVSETTLVATIAKATGVATENVVWGAGSGELLVAAVRAFTSASKPLVTPWPTFETPRDTAAKIGTPVKEIPLDDHQALDVDRLLAAASGAGLVYFCNPNNPSSTVHGHQTMVDFLTRLKATSPDTVVLFDEAYHDYVTDPSYASVIPEAVARPNVIVTRTFSKAHGMAGVRLGYAIGQRATVRPLSRYRNGLGMSVPGVAAGVVSLGDTAHIARERDRNTTVRDFTLRAFTEIGFPATDAQANFIYVKIGAPTDPFRNGCRDAGILIGRAFAPEGNPYCRISLGTMPEMARAVGVFRRLLTARPSAARSGGRS